MEWRGGTGRIETEGPIGEGLWLLLPGATGEKTSDTFCGL